MCENVVDYYNILECERTASYDELKKNYQRLALLFHPDKKDSSASDENFLLIQKAWSVLRDPESHMTFDISDGAYIYPCRCSGLYYLETSDATPPTVIVGCNECSFSIQVNIP